MSVRDNQFDKLDYEIIKALHENARVAASEISRQTGANERTIRKRIERLIADDVIRLTAILNPQAFGFITAADIFIQVAPDKEDSVLDALMSMPEVTYVAFGQGTNDISIEARFKDNDAFREFIRTTLTNMDGVTIDRYTLVPRILRNIDEWMPPADEFETE